MGVGDNTMDGYMLRLKNFIDQLPNDNCQVTMTRGPVTMSRGPVTIPNCYVP